MKEEYESCPNLDNFTHVDALILNIERACQATKRFHDFIRFCDSMGVQISDS